MKSLLKQKVSVVVPVYNESGNLKLFHWRLVKALRGLRRECEVIYIDDGSTDGTYEYLKRLETASRRVPQERPLIPSSPYFSREVLVRVIRKEGRRGKAFSLVEGFAASTGEVLVMIDGDLRYPPEAIAYMVHELDRTDVVVARRGGEGFFARIRMFLGKLFSGLDCDVWAGLKVFRREVYQTAWFSPSSARAFDLEFLHRAKAAGFRILSYDVYFVPVAKGVMNRIYRGWEIILNTIAVRMRRMPPLMIPPDNQFSMRGAGVGYKRKKFISHTTLPFDLSAFYTFTPVQIMLGLSLVYLFVAGILVAPLTTGRVVVGILSTLYFLDVLFHLFLVLRSIHNDEEIQFSQEELSTLRDDDLPVYTILCPLYKEAHVVPQFMESISRLEWQKEKLDVMFLLEEDDESTVKAVEEMGLPSFVRTVVVPHSMPKTKPKACNYGLSFARGEYLVIYDAEDAPDPLQLKKAFLGFQKLPENVKCLQAKLNYYNPRQNLLTRLFTAEYSLWFELMLTGLQSFRSSIPLGGTSNHFRTQDLRDLQGWDPFNVTEDADLGARLFQAGYKTEIIDSTTLEEANSRVKNWIRQRSRWIKGYMQTYLVHTRNFSGFVRKNGFKHAFIFQLTVGGKLLFVILNPFLWVVTVLYFLFYPVLGSIIQSLYVPPVSYLAVISWVFGNFLFLYYYMIACAKRKDWDLVKYVYLMPVYWAMMSYAAVVALYQLFFKPHYWEKTVHGLHLAAKDYAIQLPTADAAFVTAKRKTLPKLAWGKISLSVLSLAALLSMDVVLVFLLFERDVFENYLYISIVGKSVFLLSQVFGVLVTWFIDKRAVRRSSKRTFNNLVFFTFIFCWTGFVLFGLGGEVDSGFYMFGIMCFALVNVFTVYNIRGGIYTFVAVCLAMRFLQAGVIYAGVTYQNTSLSEVTRLLCYAGVAELLLMILLRVNTHYIRVLENNLWSVFGLLRRRDTRGGVQDFVPLRILIFNWRDTKHVYAGGAEVYVHELAKRWVADGNRVTLFCGNDNRNPSNEVVDGVEVVRCGGTYTVYIFAFIYYLLKFRNKYDLIIDCENGIPFFTPLYVRKPVVLLIHHVHQEIFRIFLKFPNSSIAKYMESRLMPLVYRNKRVVTVSDSSREEIFKLGFTDSQNINIIHSGAVENAYYNLGKFEYPAFMYLGRLKRYKRIDVAIRSFAFVVKKYPKARLLIVGSGEAYPELRDLVLELGLVSSVDFYGKVTEEDKSMLLAQSWVVLQPSQVEGWGITVIEANAAGTPVVASRVSGLRDSVIDGKTGLLVEYGNMEQFAWAMMKLVENVSLREHLSQGAYSWSKQFCWNKSAEAFYRVMGKSLKLPEGKLSKVFS